MEVVARDHFGANAFRIGVDGHLDVSLPHLQCVDHSREVSKQAHFGFWYLGSQPRWIIDQLDKLAVLVKCFGRDALISGDAHLDIDPGVFRQGDRLRDVLVKVLSSEGVHSERALRVHPQGECILNFKHVVAVTTHSRTRTVRMLASILNPH